MLWFTQWPGLCQAEARSLKLYWGLPCGFRDSSTWAIVCCFPRCTSRKLDGKWTTEPAPALPWDPGIKGSSITGYAMTAILIIFSRHGKNVGKGGQIYIASLRAPGLC